MKSASRTNLVVIGAGPGGYVAAIRASQLGMKVTMVEKDRPGGLCLNWGCIPSKALLKSAEMYEELKKGAAFGITAEKIGFDLSAIVDRSRGISERIVSGVEYLFKKYSVQSIKGVARLVSPKKVEVATAQETLSLSADLIVIATGTRPRDLPGMARDGERIISSKEALVLKTLPKRLVVIGAGAIGMEFAYFYSCLGSEVTILEALPRALPIEDDEVSDIVAKSFKRRGLQIDTDARVASVARKKEEVEIQYEASGAKKILKVDIALVAVGVTANTDGLGLETLGIKTHKNGIAVDEHLQTSVPGVYAIGDVIGPPWLAHVASAEGVHAVEHIAGLNPRVINCKPEVASVGLNERKAKEMGVEYTIGRFQFRASGRALAAGDTDGMVKLLFEKKYGGLIGAHIVGGEATEMIHELALAINLEATAEEIGKTVHAHPTYGESVMEAALDAIGERIHGA